MYSNNQETAIQQRKNIEKLLDEAKLACNRPLFEEIGIWNSTVEEQISKRSKHFSIEAHSFRSWTTILSDLSKLLPFMNTNEQELVSKYSAIFLLGILNPNSTGCNFLTLRSNTLNNFIGLDLEERLENTSRYFSADEFGQINVCIDEPRERVFKIFLQSGLASMWRESVASNSTDILHLVAMVIAPQLDTSLIANIVAPWEDIPAWVKTSRLMGCLYAHSFPLHYSHRLFMVKIVFENLFLPEIDTPNAMLAGAVPHLLASLHTFAHHIGHNPADSHLAQKALVQIATQTGQESIVREVFYCLLSQTIEDKNRYKYLGEKPIFCLHAARGELLQCCIIKFNGSRHYADGTFTEQALKALNASLEELLFSWKKGVEEPPDSNSACVLSALLGATEALFYFLLDYEDTTNLLRVIIQMLHHPDRRVRKASSSLLSLAISYIKNAESLMISTFESIKSSIEMILLQPKIEMQEFHPIISVASRKSTKFALSFLSFLIKSRQEKSNWRDKDSERDVKIANNVSYLLVSAAMPNPRAAWKKAPAIQSLFKNEIQRNNSAAAGNIIVALLSIRKACIFQDEYREISRVILRFVSESVGWRAYQIAYHAMCTGNFVVAKILYANLLHRTSTEKSFLWMNTLFKISEAETYLNENGAKGIPHATTSLQAAVSYSEALSSQHGHFASFQIEFLRLWLDFLDLLSGLRLICRETRLSGIVPKNTTRVGVHLMNNLKCWEALAKRYFSLYRRHGLFLCMQSRATLRTTYSICKHLRYTSMKLIGETTTNKNEEYIGPKGDEMQPVIRLQKEIDNAFISKLDKFVEPAVRTTALVELLEGICRTPMPFPRGFTRTIKVSPTTFRISFDPSHKYTVIPEEELQTLDLEPTSETATIHTATELTVCVTGFIPEDVVKRASPNFSRLLIWGNIKCISKSNNNFEEGKSEQPTETRHKYVKKGIRVPTIEIHMPQSRKFTAHIEVPPIKFVGIYKIDFNIGCRDIACGEWELLSFSPSKSIIVKVTKKLKDW